MDFENLRFLVVGAGLSGATVAERLASDLGVHVMVIDRRNHTGGNCHSVFDDATGIECHRYGTHIFHTGSREVWDYVNRFMAFTTYRHRVLTRHRGRVYQMPVNLATINEFYGTDYTPEQAREHISREIEREHYDNPLNLEEKAISLIGRPLYEALIKGYTEKQWETPLTELPPSIITRLPVRYTYEPAYFDDPFQGLPVKGYCGLFDALLSHRHIEVHLGVDYFDIRSLVPPQCTVVYTGPIDRFFGYRHGRLGWRTSRFEEELLEADDFQGTSVMNYADRSVPFTRIHEFRHLHPERNYAPGRTIIFREFSLSGNHDLEPFYPIDTEEDRALYRRYLEDSRQCPAVTFAGRMGLYRYFNMDRAIEKALSLYEEVIRPAGGRPADR